MLLALIKINFYYIIISHYGLCQTKGTLIRNKSSKSNIPLLIISLKKTKSTSNEPTLEMHGLYGRALCDGSMDCSTYGRPNEHI